MNVVVAQSLSKTYQAGAGVSLDVGLPPFIPAVRFQARAE